MTNRFWDAHMIQQGACNPSGVARSLVKAIDEARGECADTDSVCADPAVRMICHQLAFLLRVSQIDCDIATYDHLVAECRDRAEPHI